MKSRFAVLLPLFATAHARAAPAWKAAPKTETDQEAEGGLPFAFDLETVETEWLRTGLEFLGNYYGYMAVAFVALVLFLFSRRAGDGQGAPADDGDEDFFEPGDAGPAGRSR